MKTHRHCQHRNATFSVWWILHSVSPSRCYSNSLQALVHTIQVMWWYFMLRSCRLSVTLIHCKIVSVLEYIICAGIWRLRRDEFFIRQNRLSKVFCCFCCCKSLSQNVRNEQHNICINSIYKSRQCTWVAKVLVYTTDNRIFAWRTIALNNSSRYFTTSNMYYQTTNEITN